MLRSGISDVYWASSFTDGCRCILRYQKPHAEFGQATYAASVKSGGDRRIGRMAQGKKIPQKLVSKKIIKKQYVKYDIG